jgi:tetratricopeptide (TPR) repeat protein
MLTRPCAVALALHAALFASFAWAGEPDAPSAPAANVETSGDAVKAPAGVAYPHIYQAPLFGSLFAVAANEAVVDESGLRYYASLHNVARANAEIRRLKALHPNWTPPTNIYAAAGAGNDEQPFWDLLAADRLEELRAGIALRMKSEPGWKPSRDLTVKIERKAAIEKLATFSDAEQWTGVLDIADSDPSILHCAYMDADWRVAEAFLKIGQASRGFEIYHAIIASCPDHDDRLTTIRKAITRFSIDQTKSLIAMGAKSSYGAQEFDGVKVELTRARIGAVNMGARDEIEPDALGDFFAELERTHDRADLALAGWYEYGRGRYGEADRWFSLGAPESPPARDAEDVKFAEGHALSLLKSDQIDAALHVAWKWRDASDTMRRTYTNAMISLLTRSPSPPAITDAMLAEFVATLEKDRNFEGGQALAWYRQNRHEWDEAATWFRTALAWKGIDTNAPPAEELSDPAAFKAIEGLATALANAGRADEALAIADAWRSTDRSLRALFITMATNAIDAAEHAGAIAPDRLLHFAEMAAADRSAAGGRALGWYEHRSGDFASSIDWFGKSVAWSPNGKGDLKTNEGLALALKQAGRLAEAEEIAWTWRRQSAEMRATYISTVVSQLTRDETRAAVGAARVERFAGLVRAERSALGAGLVSTEGRQLRLRVVVVPFCLGVERRSGERREERGRAGPFAAGDRPVRRRRGHRLRLARKIARAAGSLRSDRGRGADPRIAGCADERAAHGQIRGRRARRSVEPGRAGDRLAALSPSRFRLRRELVPVGRAMGR